MKLPVSAMVVGYNEGHFLKQCFESISFCDEITYVDLGSTDNSVEIARNYFQHVFYRNKDQVPSGEIAQAEVVQYLKHDWVLFIDPDEKLDESLVNQIKIEFNKIINTNNLGAILVPWQFYFKAHKLKGTVWGGTNKKYLLVHKYRFNFYPITHYGRNIKDGFLTYEIILNDKKSNIMHHYWMNSYLSFFKKHRRYLKKEGRDNYNRGVRISSRRKLLFTPFTEFFSSYFKYKGYKDGILGIFLSSFWACYKTYLDLDILKIQKTNKSFFEDKQLKTQTNEKIVKINS